VKLNKITKKGSDIAFAFRSAFSGEDGRVALTWIMRRCMLGQKCESEKDMILYNFGVDLLEEMGVYHLVHEADIVDALRDLPLIVEEEDK